MSQDFPLPVSSRGPQIFTAASGQTEFPVSLYPIQDDADVAVELDTGDGFLPQELDEDYSITGAGEAGGFTIVFSTPLTAGDKVRHKGAAPIENLTNFSPGNTLKTAGLNAKLDRLTIVQQEMRRDLSDVIPPVTLATQDEARAGTNTAKLMTPALTGDASVRLMFRPETEAWLRAIPAGDQPSSKYIRAVDDLINGFVDGGWWGVHDVIALLCAERESVALVNVRRATTMVKSGAAAFVPGFGFQGDGASNIDTLVDVDAASTHYKQDSALLAALCLSHELNSTAREIGTSAASGVRANLNVATASGQIAAVINADQTPTTVADSIPNTLTGVVRSAANEFRIFQEGITRATVASTSGAIAGLGTLRLLRGGSAANSSTRLLSVALIGSHVNPNAFPLIDEIVLNFLHAIGRV